MCKNCFSKFHQFSTIRSSPVLSVLLDLTLSAHFMSDGLLLPSKVPTTKTGVNGAGPSEYGGFDPCSQRERGIGGLRRTIPVACAPAMALSRQCAHMCLRAKDHAVHRVATFRWFCAPRKFSPAAQRTGGHREWFQEGDGRLGYPKRITVSGIRERQLRLPGSRTWPRLSDKSVISSMMGLRQWVPRWSYQKSCSLWQPRLRAVLVTALPHFT